MGLNELAYQIFSEQMEEFATRNERMVLKGGRLQAYDPSKFYGLVEGMPDAEKALKSQRDGVSSRGGSILASNYKGAKNEGLLHRDWGPWIISIPPTTSKLRSLLKHKDNFYTRKADARKEAKKHEGAKELRRAWNAEHQKKYHANKDTNERLKANGYI